MAEVLEANLSGDERALLVSGLREWGGGAKPTPAVATLVGFEDVDALLLEGGAIARLIDAREALSAADWRRALLATEIAFASDLVGSGVDWATTTGLSDEESLRVLRSLQRKLARLVSSAH